jgi:iron(III) transport system substrate-binding protein
VKVTVFQATTGKVMARLEAEQANPQADVLISASWDTAEDLHQRAGCCLFTAPTPTRYRRT